MIDYPIQKEKKNLNLKMKKRIFVNCILWPKSFVFSYFFELLIYLLGRFIWNKILELKLYSRILINLNDYIFKILYKKNINKKMISVIYFSLNFQ